MLATIIIIIRSFYLLLHLAHSGICFLKWKDIRKVLGIL